MCKDVTLSQMASVRSAVPQDLEFVVLWVRTPHECERWAGAQVAFPIDLPSLHSAIGFTPQNSYVLADGDGAVIAFGQILDKPDGRQHLARFIVSPDARRRGNGRAFLAELLHRATADRISLNVHRDNTAAIALYAAAGFEDAERPAGQSGSLGSRYMERQRSR